MKVSFGSSFYSAVRKDGTGVYADNLIRAMGKVAPDNQYKVYSLPRNNMMRFPALAMWYGWNFTGLSAQLAVDKPDVFVGLDICLPFYKNTLYVVYDITPITEPGTMPYVTTKIFEALVWDAVKTAKRIVAISQATKYEVVKHFGIKWDDVDVVYAGIDHDVFKPMWSKEVLRKHGLDGKRYALFVGTLVRKKNIIRIAQAFSKAAIKDMELVVVGQGYLGDSEIRAALDKPNIRQLGYLPLLDLPVLMTSAEMFVWPSLHEGFGMPVAEAMACGCPVITSNVSAMPEIAGDAAVLVNPYDVDDIAYAIKVYAEAKDARNVLSKRGLARAKLFTWENTAKGMMEVIKQCGNG